MKFRIGNIIIALTLITPITVSAQTVRINNLPGGIKVNIPIGGNSGGLGGSNVQVPGFPGGGNVITGNKNGSIPSIPGNIIRQAPSIPSGKIPSIPGAKIPSIPGVNNGGGIGGIFGGSGSGGITGSLGDSPESLVDMFRRRGYAGADGYVRDAYRVNRTGADSLTDQARDSQLPEPYLDPDSNQFVPYERKTYINTYGTSDGMESAMYGGLGDFGNENMKSPLAVYGVTWGLTEPAVAQAMQNSIQNSMLLTMTRMASEQAFFAKLNALPEVRDAVMQAYNSCVYTRVSSAKGMGWSEAVADCMREKPWSSTSTKVNTGFNFIEDPNAQENGNGGYGGGANKMYLSYYLFNQEGLGHGLATSIGIGGLSGKAPLSIEKIRQLFANYIGDIEFTIGDKTTGSFSDATGLSTGADSSARTLSYKKLAPTAKSAGQYLREDRTPTVYNALIDIIFGYCKWQNGISASAPQHTTLEYSAENIARDPSLADYWTNTNLLPDDTLKQLTASVFTFNRSIGEALYQVTRPGSDCSALDKGNSDKFAYDIKNVWEQRGNTISASFAGTGQKQPRPEQEFYYFLALKVAKAQVLDALIDMENFINNLTVGTFNDTFMKQRGLQLIYEAAGSPDLNGLREANRQELIQFLGKLQMKASQNAGRGGANMMRSPNEGSTAKAANSI